MYLDKVISILRAYETVYLSNNKAYNDSKSKNKEAFGSGSVYDQKDQEAKTSRDNNIAAAKEEAKKIINDTFLSVSEKVNAYITVPVPDDFAPTLEAIKLMSDGITQAEADTFLKKYQENYLAFRSLSVWLEANTKLNAFSVAADEIIDDIDEYRIMCLNWLDNYNMNSSISQAFLITEVNNPLDSLDNKIDAFIGGYIVEYMNVA